MLSRKEKARIVAQFAEDRVVADNYKRKATVHTRGGLVKYEQKRFAFMFAYGIVILFGLGFLIVFLGWLFQ
jgi:hypothetical protein